MYGIPTPYEGYFIPLKYFTSFVDAMDYCNELNKQLYTRYIQRTNECNKELCLEHLKELTDLVNELCV